jgi:hypothetical protein
MVVEESPGGDGTTLTAQGDLAVWTDLAIADNVRIRGWAPDGLGVRTLVDSIVEETVVLGLSPTNIVGLVRKSSLTVAPNGAFEDGYLWASPRVYSVGTPTEIRKSPKLTLGTIATGPLRAWGDYVACEVGPTTRYGDRTGPPYLLVVQLSTWKMWRVDLHTADQYEMAGNTLTLTPKYLYIGEHQVPLRDPSVSAGDPNALTRMLRVAWGDLPKVATEIAR